MIPRCIRAQYKGFCACDSSHVYFIINPQSHPYGFYIISQYDVKRLTQRNLVVVLWRSNSIVQFQRIQSGSSKSPLIYLLTKGKKLKEKKRRCRESQISFLHINLLLHYIWCFCESIMQMVTPTIRLWEFIYTYWGLDNSTYQVLNIAYNDRLPTKYSHRISHRIRDRSK